MRNRAVFLCAYIRIHKYIVSGLKFFIFLETQTLYNLPPLYTHYILIRRTYTFVDAKLTIGTLEDKTPSG